MFLQFFTSLRDAQVPVTLREYLTLMEALDADLAEQTVENFYYLSRAALVKDERNLDKFDRVFGTVFKGLESLLAAMISNLLVMVIVGGYETFVSRLNLQGHPDEPEWLSHVNASVLKIKLAMAIIGISSIHLLRTFIEAGALSSGKGNYTETGVMWQTIIHCVFILSAIGIAIVDKLSNDSIEGAKQQVGH